MWMRLEKIGMKFSMLFASAALAALVVPAAAQNANVEGRVGKLEKEMKAVQRKVFPDGAGKYFEPEIKPADPVKDPSKATSGSEVTDLIARVDALESQLAALTGTVEQQGNGMKAMETRLKSLEAQVKTLSAADATPAVSSPTTTSTTPAAVAKPAAPKPAATTPTAKPSASRAAAVAKVEKSATGDAGEDAYNYGYRLWEAKFFPEAQVQLEDVVKKYPKHKRISHARNLLGRAWLDDGRPSQAAKIFYDNYKTNPEGERAPESLYFLGESLIAMDKPTDACDVFGQLVKAYPDVAAGRLSARVTAGRQKAKCK
jgi:TolA-binding protein